MPKALVGFYSKSGITRTMAVHIVMVAVLMGAGGLGLFHHFLPEGETVARTVVFTAVVVFEMVRLTMIRPRYRLSVFSNLDLAAAMALSILFQLVVIYLPWMNDVFKTAPLEGRHWLSIAAVTLVIFAVGVAGSRLLSTGDRL